MCPDFVLSRTPQIPWQKHTSEHFFYRTAPSGCFQIWHVTRGGEGGEVSPALFQSFKKSALILEKRVLNIFIYGLNLSFKKLFKVYLGKKFSKFFHAGPFLRVLQIKCLSEWPYFKKTPLPWKIPGYVLANVSYF